MNDTERLLADFEEKLYQALKAAFEQTRGEIDTATLAHAIATDNSEVIMLALDVADGELREALDKQLAEAIAPIFEVAGIMEARALGFPRFTLEKTALVMRDNWRFRVTSELSQSLRDSALRSVRIMLETGEPPKNIARFITRNIGLTPGQQRSLDTFRSMLVRGRNRKAITFNPAQLRRLNASQRSILRKLNPSILDNDDIDRLTNQQRQTMENHRARTIGRTRAYELYNTSRQATWEQLDRHRLIKGYKRYWITARDERVRHTHNAVPLQNNGGRGLQEPFSTHLGPVHLPPLEVNCRCRVALRRAK